MPQSRLFEFIAIWSIAVFLSYTMRRVKCAACGIKVEAVPWAQGKHGCCDVYRHFLASWARRLSWKDTASCFNTSWDTVCRSVKWVVAYGLEHRDLEDITAIGVDEVSYSKGHQYMTLVYQIDKGRKRLLGVIKDRKIVRTLRAHEDLLMNYFKARMAYSSGIVEGSNFRVGLCMGEAYGYRSFELLKISLFHTLGDLHEPKFTHKFC